METTKELEAWVDNIRPFVLEGVGKGLTDNDAIEYGMKRYGDILTELAEQKTERSKLAVEAIKTAAYQKANI